MGTQQDLQLSVSSIPAISKVAYVRQSPMTSSKACHVTHVVGGAAGAEELASHVGEVHEAPARHLLEAIRIHQLPVVQSRQGAREAAIRDSLPSRLRGVTKTADGLQ
jgi:hypothetical protein